MSWTGSPRYTQRKGQLSYSHEPEEYPAKRSRNSTAAEEAWGLTPRHRPSIFQQRARRSSAAGSARLNAPNRRLTRAFSTLAHYATLVVASDPIKQHQQYRAEQERQDAAESASSYTPHASDSDQSLLDGVSEGNESDVEGGSHAAQQDALTEEEAEAQEAADCHQLAKERWTNACRSIVASAQMIRDASKLSDPTAKGRFAAVAALEMRLGGHPNKLLLLEALAKQKLSRFDSLLDRILSELLISGETVFDWFTPAKLGHHRLLFTPALLFITWAVFFFMAGLFPAFELQTSPTASTVQTCMTNTSSGGEGYGVRYMLAWFGRSKVQWCYGGSAWLFSTEFLQQWGARWGPLMRSQPSRWVTSWFVHVGFQHVLSNSLLFAMVAYQLEEKYGCWRITLLWALSALGGNLFSAAFESTCIAVVGASGGVFGIMGLFIADMIMNFKTITRPVLRGLMMLAFLVYFIVTVATGSAGTSHFSHVGGFVCGLFPAFLFLPNLGHEKWEAVLPIIAVPILLCVYVGLPLYFYKHRLPDSADCSLVTG